MKLVKVIIISLILSTLLLLSPLFFMSSATEALSLGASILSAMAGVGAIIFGVIIYDDLGLGKRLFDKQADSVIELLEEIKGIRMQASFYRKGELRGIIMFGANKAHSFDQSYSSTIDDVKIDNLLVAFSPNNYYEGLTKITKLRSSIWMPPELVPKLEVISWKSMIAIDSEDIEKYLSIIIKGNKEDIALMKFIDEDLTFKQYFTAWQNVIVDLETWLRRHSKAALKLNL